MKVDPMQVVASLAKEIVKKVEEGVLSFDDVNRFSEALKEFVDSLPEEERKRGVVVFTEEGPMTFIHEDLPKLVLKDEKLLRLVAKTYAVYDEVAKFVRKWKKKRKKTNFRKATSKEAGGKALILSPCFETATAIVDPLSIIF